MRRARAAVLLALALSVLLITPVAAGLPLSLDVVINDDPDPVVAGTNLTYDYSVINLTPFAGSNLSVSASIPAGTTFVSFTTPGGWTAATPAVGGTGSVTVTAATLNGSSFATFFLVVHVDAATPGGTVLNLAVSATADPSGAASEGEDTNVVAAPAASQAASVPDAAMVVPSPVSPAATIGFLALTVALLVGTALIGRRRTARAGTRD